MKIHRKIRDVHYECSEKCTRLEMEVKSKLGALAAESGWFFLSRVKEEESFALKIETGRCKNLLSLEDFYGCTIVVPRFDQIAVAEQLVLANYDKVDRRPNDDRITHKTPSSFEFDDLRLYVRRRAVESGINDDLTGTLFEVQIKTILQHAWALATHDLIYKSETVSWPRERIAYQVKAVLEHAEIAIASASMLSEAVAVAKMDEKTRSILDIMQTIKAKWPAQDLPQDVRRLATTIQSLLRCAKLRAEDLELIVNSESERVGLLPKNLSPYAFILQALINKKDCKFQERLGEDRSKFSIVIHSDMDLPQWCLTPSDKIINLDIKPVSGT